jgi:lipopolysaccharide/colanic/teichoic acid biosynthesis glycosyltransferase
VVDDAPVGRRFAYRWVKRGIDVLGSLVCLLVLAPLFLVVAVLVKWTSPGPVFYAWDVIGRGGRPFRGYKFRTMVHNADDLKSQLAHLNEMSGPAFKVQDDPRITPVGRWLRKYSLDELPQLWSVLKGDMSLVGPRPPGQNEWPHFEDWQRRKVSVTPGLTCLWQVRGRNRINRFDEWAELDLQYIDHWSLALDIRILVQTVGVVVRGSGW